MSALRPNIMVVLLLSAWCAVSVAKALPEYVVRESSAEHLKMDAPVLPDLSPYTHAALLAKRVRKEPGQVLFRRLVDLDAFDEFVGGDGRLAIWAAKQQRNPVAIVLDGGYFTPQSMLEQLPPEQFEQLSAGVYIARLPILVSQSATLHLDAATSALRLSLQGGAFLVNEGRLFITDSAVESWDELQQRPVPYLDKSQFRPFITAWAGSQVYFSRSRFSSLGYGASKSYGITLSQFSASLAGKLHRRAPTGWILESTFEDLLYGFYCYEADDVVIVGNVYRENIVYGIDPHDRSHRLIIARNTAYNTRQRHGIIVSREVNDSWIFENESYDNKLSGIMLDRQSSNNIVANNSVHGNGSDGITVYESPNNLLYANESIGNSAHGYHIRNSVGVKLYQNRAIANGYSGVYGHAKQLTDGDRDLELDPYSTEVSLIVVGGELINNQGGPMTIDQPLSVELFGVGMMAPLDSNGLQMQGVLGENLHQVLDLMIRQRKAVIIEPGTRDQPRQT